MNKIRIYLKRCRQGILCVVVTILLSACAKNLDGDFCLLYEPVYSSAQDTEETQKQIDNNNVVWEVLCETR